MTIQQYINSLDNKYNNYCVDIEYIVKEQCTKCYKYYTYIDDEYSIKGFTVGELKAENTEAHKQYNFVFECDFEISRTTENTIIIQTIDFNSIGFICKNCTKEY